MLFFPCDLLLMETLNVVSVCDTRGQGGIAQELLWPTGVNGGAVPCDSCSNSAFFLFFFVITHSYQIGRIIPTHSLV